jgi:hypothetical protein
MGTRLCGCPEVERCVHKDASGKPLPSYDEAYKNWRRRTDLRAAAATLLWFLGRKLLPEGSIRRIAAALIQLLR